MLVSLALKYLRNASMAGKKMFEIFIGVLCTAFIIVTVVKVVASKPTYDMKLTCTGKVMLLCKSCYNSGDIKNIYLSESGKYVMHNHGGEYTYTPIQGESCDLLVSSNEINN